MTIQTFDISARQKIVKYGKVPFHRFMDLWIPSFSLTLDIFADRLGIERMILSFPKLLIRNDCSYVFGSFASFRCWEN